MKHSKIVWNLNTKQWFCTTCGRTSEQNNEPDAHVELAQSECRIPYVESSGAAPGEETVQLVKKPFKMELKNKTD